MNVLTTPSRRRPRFGALYLSEAAPIGYLWWALPTQLGESGVPIEEVTTFTALLTVAACSLIALTLLPALRRRTPAALASRLT